MAIPLILLLSLVPGTPITFVGMIDLLSFLLIVIGMLTAPWLAKRTLTLILLGFMLAFALTAIRIASPPTGSSLELITLPAQSGPRLLNRILNEQDVVLFGAQVGQHFGL